MLRGLLHRYGFVCELADDTSADGLPDGALFANWAASVKLKLLEEESPGQVFWASPLDSHCIFLPLSLLDPTSNLDFVASSQLLRTPLSVLWPVSGFWQEDTARKW